MLSSNIDFERQTTTVMDTNFAILNPQDKIPDVASKFTIVKDEIVPIDLNEDEWSKDYFVMFFHTGPQDPAATKLLNLLDKKNNPGIDTFPCKLVTVSMDSPQAIQDWTKTLPDFDVPMLSDKENDIAKKFGVLMGTNEVDHPGSGYCANSVFVIDKFDRVRYHSVLDARCVHDLDELARVVNALKATDSGKIAMAGWKGESDSVTNTRGEIMNWYNPKKRANNEDQGTLSKLISKMRKALGGKEDPVEVSDEEAKSLESGESDSEAETEEIKTLSMDSETMSWQYASGSLVISQNVSDKDKDDTDVDENQKKVPTYL